MAPPIAGWPRPGARVSGPFAPPALPGFIAPTSPSVPAPRIGTRLLVGPPLGGLPWHRGTGSRVPHKSLRWAHAVFVPATTRAPAGRPPGSSQTTDRNLVSMASSRFRHVVDGSLSFVFPAHT